MLTVFTKGEEILLTHNPLRRQYLKQQATDKVCRLYPKTHERSVKAGKDEREEEENANCTFKKDYWGQFISTST